MTWSFAFLPPIIFSTILTRLSYRDTKSINFWIFFTLWASIIYWGGFFCIGTAELATGQPLFSAFNAFLATSLVGIIFWAILSKHKQFENRLQNTADPLIEKAWPTTKLLLYGSTLAVLIASLITSIGFPSGFEARAYAMPSAVALFRSQSLLPQWSDHVYAFPLNFPLYFGHLAQILPEQLLSLSNLPFAIIFGGAVYALFGTISANKNLKLLAVLLCFGIPIFGLHIWIPFPDLGGLAFALIGLYLTITQKPEERLKIFLAGAALGIAFGFKLLHLIPAAILPIIMIIAFVTKSMTKRETIRAIALYTSGFLLLAGFWLLRNWIIFNNPFYPADLPVIGSLMAWESAPDVDYANRQFTEHIWISSSAKWIIYPWIESHSSSPDFTGSSGLGLGFAALFPLAMLAFAKAAFGIHKVPWTGKIPHDRNLYIIALITILTTAAWWWASDRQPRYLGFSLTLMVLLGLSILDDMGEKAQRIAGHLIQFCAIVMIGVISSIQAKTAIGHSVLNNSTQRFDYYQYPQEIDQLPHGSRILNLAERTWNYSLLGKGWRNDVIPYVRSVATFAPDYYFAQPLPDYKLDPCKAVQQHGAQYIFATRPPNISICNKYRVEEITRLDTNPYNGQVLPRPRILYAIVPNGGEIDP